MTRRGFHILLAVILAICAICPYIEVAVNWNQSVFETGYDTESTVAVIALLLIFAFTLGSLLINFPASATAKEGAAASTVRVRPSLDFILTLQEASPPPLPLRI